MQIDILKEGFELYLLAIKQAYESGGFSEADCTVLSTLFEQGLFYQNLVKNASLCNDQTLQNIVEFCDLIEHVLPAPEVVAGEPLDLVKPIHKDPFGPTEDLLDSLAPVANRIFNAVILHLMGVFQCSILDLSVELKANSSLSKIDIENLNYVVGMAEITTMNLGSVIKQVERGDGITGMVRKFFVDAVRFASRLRAGGLGMVG